MEQRVDNEVNYLATAVEELGDAALETGLADGLTGRITLIDAAGNVLYDSYEDPACMENHAMRPEVAQAIKEGYGSANRYSTTYAKRSYYAAVRLSNDQILRVGDTIDSVYGVLFPGIGMLLLPLALLLGLSFVIIDKTTKRMMEPLLHINLDEPRKDVQYDEMVPFLRRIEEQNEALKEQMQERNKQQQEYAAITENMKDGLIVTNRHRVLSINRAAQRIFEIRPEECMGQNIIVVNRNQKLKEVVDGALSGKDMIKHMTIDDVIYELHGNPVMQDGYTSGVVIFIMDVTQKKQLEIMRQEFSANVSHELKTPIALIQGYAEGLKEGITDDPESMDFYCSVIIDEASKMNTMVKKLLTLNQIEFGNEELVMERFDIIELVSSVVNANELRANQKGINMIFNLNNSFEHDRFKEYVNQLYKQKAIVEVKKKLPNRTLAQNSYLHLLLGYFGGEYGCSLGEAKIDFYKRTCNRDLFERKTVNKKGNEVTYLRSSAELTTGEMTLSIDRFRNWSASVAGIYLPAANEHQMLIYAQQEIQRNQEFI